MTTTTEPYYEALLMEDEHPSGRIGHACGTCLRDVGDGPCPDHAPREVPGLTLVDCDAEPRHWLWVHAGDYYPPPCYRCELNRYHEADQDRLRCRHGRWRTLKVLWRFTSWLYALGVLSGTGVRTCDRYPGRWCLSSVSWRGSRPYALGWPTWKWRCVLRMRHWPGEPIGFESCGKCVPWYCCGSTRFDHAEGCPEDAPAVPS